MSAAPTRAYVIEVRAGEPLELGDAIRGAVEKAVGR